jgi:NAD(P)-dependent dehydrogenase (short-subunit alcohol dehydrogenase family)
MLDLKGKKAVVIGGSTGIGLGIAQALSQRGGEVLVTGTNEANLSHAKQVLGERGAVLASDITGSEGIRVLGATVEARFGQIDAVFLNAGFCQLTPFAQVSEEEYDRTFAINTKGAFFSAQRLAPLMRAQGAFVFTTSIADTLGYAGMSVYSGAKAALRSFAQVFAAELAPRGIRANALSPGFVRTPTMGLHGASAEQIEAFVREGELLTPLKRIATVDEVARAALFLAFEATFVSGIELVIDGGLSNFVAPPSHA